MWLLPNKISELNVVMQKNIYLIYIMKVIAINGSPRKDGNSMALLNEWIKGIKHLRNDADVEVINLYDYSYTGCRSCFSCKRKGGKFYGTCPIRDGLYELIPKVQHADAVAIAAPMYFGSINAYTKAFLERLLFSVTTYRKNHDSVAPKNIPFTMIYSMNATKELAESHGYLREWDEIEWYISNAFRMPVNRVVAYYTYQFKHYEDYEMEMFSEEDKRNYRTVHFPEDLKKARDAGMDVAERLGRGINK